MKQVLWLLFWIGLELLIIFYPEILVTPIMWIAMCPWILVVLLGKK